MAESRSQYWALGASWLGTLIALGTVLWAAFSGSFTAGANVAKMSAALDANTAAISDLKALSGNRLAEIEKHIAAEVAKAVTIHEDQNRRIQGLEIREANTQNVREDRRAENAAQQAEQNQRLATVENEARAAMRQGDRNQDAITALMERNKAIDSAIENLRKAIGDLTVQQGQTNVILRRIEATLTGQPADDGDTP